MIEEPLMAPRVKSLAEVERQAILDALIALHGDKIRAAKALGITPRTLYRRLGMYDIPLTTGLPPRL